MARKLAATNRTIASNGYVLIWKPEHPGADVRGYVYEHRLIAEEKIGRPLLSGELAHHKDGNKTNNAPENIEIISSVARHRFEHRNPSSNLRKPNESNEIITCQCGCGEKFEKFDKLGRPRKYISGHNLRGFNG